MKPKIQHEGETWYLALFPEEPKEIDNPHQIVGLGIPELASYMAAERQAIANKLPVVNPGDNPKSHVS